jgi:hypothetical protein
VLHIRVGLPAESNVDRSYDRATGERPQASAHGLLARSLPLARMVKLLHHWRHVRTRHDGGCAPPTR